MPIIERPIDGGQTKKDKAASDLISNIAIADITKVGVDDFVKQITLIDASYFAAIKRAEFLSLKWNGRDKKIYAPNIVESAKWFNQINFWVQKEILKYSTVSKRTEMLSFFIKLAKHLVEINNLYSAMSIVSALQVECIYRLRLTWSGLVHRERVAYRRLEELFGQQDNCRLLREHTAAMPLPGIPYLGLYLSDLTYTNVAHPRINGQPTTVWVTKLNAIVDTIAHFQQSRFPYKVNETIRAYLLAQSYIEELQKFLEDANFKASLRLEPPLILDSPPTPLRSNGYVECPRRGASAFVRATPSNLQKQQQSSGASPSTGYASDQELGSRKKISTTVDFKTPQLLFVQVLSEKEETEGERAATGLSVPKLSLPPNPVVLLDSPDCQSHRSSVFDKTSFSTDLPAALITENQPSKPLGQSSHLPRETKEVHLESTPRSTTPSTCFKKLDRGVQVSGLTSISPTSSACILCSYHHQQQEQQLHSNDASPTPPYPVTETCFPSSSEPLLSQSDTAKTSLSAVADSSRPLPSSVDIPDLYSALLAAVKPSRTLPTDPSSKSCSDSRVSFSLPACSKEDISHWPPTNLPFVTALRAACILCEGPIRRKTVGHIIPPGLEQECSSVASSSFTDSNVPWSESPSMPSPAQPEQRHLGNAGWKSYWSALVVLENWSSAFMVYFDALTKKPFRREDFATSHCQIQPFQGPCEVSGGAFADNLPSVGLARHRNGSADESSFLLTHPGLHKTYRIRPHTVASQKKHSGDLTFHLPLTPQRGSTARRLLLFNFSRKEDCSTTPPPCQRERGVSVPTIGSDPQISDSPTLPSGLRTPQVEDWLRSLHTTLENLRP